ncbi:MAG: hypothetical protein SVW51_17570 [Pseudomonadota bacterium]|nr:hypothetical protein [Pseudomonadota bacterium]
MARISLKNKSPISIPHAIELCIEYARQKKNLSIDRVADGMGLANKWVIYKWMESGRLPATMIRPLEQTCGADFVTRYLSHAAHKLLIDVPTGRKVKPLEVNELQILFTESVSLLLAFYNGSSDQDDTMSSLNRLMESVAWHHKNIDSFQQPQLGFEVNDNE